MTGAAALTLPASPALRALRECTRELHGNLERRLRLGFASAGRDDYARHVAAMWGWLAPLEQRLAECRWPADLAPCVNAGKAGWLQQDIAAARADGFIDGEPAQSAESWPVAGVARFGWLYVIEGSMLGGQVLLRRLGERLRPWPMRYLHGYGTAAGQRWRALLAALEREVRTPAEVAAAGDGATAAFASVGSWLRERGAA